jgi:predicted transcriptional regulator
MSKLRAVVKKTDANAVAIMMGALANETRLRILYSLYQRPKTWTELMFELKLNPKSLRDNLLYLRNSHLVQKRKPKGFELTEAGKAVMELSIKQIFEAGGKTTT